MRSPCSLYVPLTQMLSKHVPAAMNTHATIEELLDALFSMRFVSYQVPNM
jgi:hypothetical protein